MRNIYKAYQQEWMPFGMYGIYIKLVCRFLQFVLGLTIFGVYTTDLVAASKHTSNLASAWLLASIVGGLSAVSALTYMVPCVHSYLFFWVDWVIVILHAGVVGVFAKAYISHGKVPTGNPSDTNVVGPNYERMRATAFIDIISGLFWLMTAVLSTLIFVRVKSEKKREANSSDLKV